jgi:hypothetical protein
MANKRKPPPPSKAVKAAAGPDNTFRYIVIALVAVVAIGTIIGVWFSMRSDSTPSATSTSAPPTAGADWATLAAAIPGIDDQHTKTFGQSHVTGKVDYPDTPPIGGNHSGVWQNCMGDIYAEQIANEHAVHSLEHGAVWITYDPSLPADQVAKLESKVRGVPYMMLSPYPGQESPISLQAWGWQLKVDNADDPRIDEFIRTLRINASQEPGAPCSGGTTAVGTTP